MAPARTLVRGVAMLALCTAACALQGPTVAGPEVADLTRRIVGHIVWSRAGDEIVALSLPDMRESVVRCASARNVDFFPSVHTLGGLDTEERIAHIDQGGGEIHPGSGPLESIRDGC